MNTRSEIFDNWSADYDQDVSAEAFPFIGYREVIETILREMVPTTGQQVLELGSGTGNLTAHLVALGCQVLAMDFSASMLAIAQRKAPQAHFVQADLLGEWPPEVKNRRFDRIVSTYLFHEFKLPVKTGLLERLAANHLHPGGKILIGDIAFPDSQARAEAQARFPDSWDEEEEFWAAAEDLPALRAAGLRAAYRQVSSCGGVLVVEPGG